MALLLIMIVVSVNRIDYCQMKEGTTMRSQSKTISIIACISDFSIR